MAINANTMIDLPFETSPPSFERSEPQVVSTFSEFLSNSSAQMIWSNDDTTNLIFFMDGDNLKRTNDTLGHTAGDELISAIFQTIKDTFSGNSIVLRKGGDEFVAYCQCNNETEVENFSRTVCKRLNEPRSFQGKNKQLNCSIGVAASEGNSLSVSELVERADVALLAAKRSGKKQLVFFGEPKCEDIKFERLVVRDFERALQSGDLTCYFQPIFDVIPRRVCGGEALLRWKHESLGMVPPKMIIKAATEVGKLRELSQFVLEVACKAALDWPPELFISVNFSASDFQHSDFSTRAIDTMLQVGIRPSRLQFEITEVEYLELTNELATNLHALKDAGVKVGVDDFGTGYSSMGSIDRLPADFIKIDRSLVYNCHLRESSRIFLRAISAVARSSGQLLIAEGVETVKELGFLSSAGITHAQGFYFDPAVPNDVFKKLICRNMNF